MCFGEMECFPINHWRIGFEIIRKWKFRIKTFANVCLLLPRYVILCMWFSRWKWLHSMGKYLHESDTIMLMHSFVFQLFFSIQTYLYFVCEFFPFNHFMEYHITDMFSYICGISNTWYRKCKCKGIFSHLYYEYYRFFHPQRNSIKLCENNHRLEIVFMNYSSEFISRQSIDCPKIAQYNFHVTCS